MKRQDALNLIRYAGYHNDAASLTRLYVENRVSLETARAKFREGAQMKANGMKCQCRECNAQ